MEKIKRKLNIIFEKKANRFNSRLDNCINSKTLAQTIHLRNKRQNFDHEKRIIFVDLDLTLFDYTVARENAAKIALQELILDVSLDRALKVYTRIVEYWHSFNLLGLPDLRRSWNNEMAYFLTIFFTSKEHASFSADLFSLLDKLEGFENIEDANDAIFEKQYLCQLFLNGLEDIKSISSIQSDVHRAVDKFDKATTKLEPLKDARELLITLKKQEGFYVFIVSEGDVNIQWGKINKLGLQDIIEPTNFIVTDGVAKPTLLLSRIDRIENKLNKQLLKDPNNGKLILKVNSLQFFRDQFAQFANKKGTFFFAQALHIAVQVISDNFDKNDFSNVSNEIWTNLPPMKLATLGDRYSNDILPLLKFFDPEQLLSIHMKFGKYKRDELKVDDPKPDFTVKKLSSARKILLNDSNWTHKYQINRPNQFPKMADNSNQVFILVGLSFGKPICTMAEAILQDAGFSQDKIRVMKNIVNKEINNAESSRIYEQRLLELFKY